MQRRRRGLFVLFSPRYGAVTPDEADALWRYPAGRVPTMTITKRLCTLVRCAIVRRFRGVLVPVLSRINTNFFALS